MKIAFIDLQNFRKLKQCRIDFSNTTTLFVGANNSGKTSAMDALGKFLAKRKFVFNDFTLSNHSIIKSIGSEWEKEECTMPNTLENWEDILPTLDIWLNVADNEIQYVSHIIPTLNWRVGILGVRFIFQPEDISKIFVDYRELYAAARETESIRANSSLSLWPKNLCDFLEKRFSSLFTLKAYILDPEKANNESPQKTPYGMECFEQDPLKGLIKIDMIEAQRGFSDPESSFNNTENNYGSSLSAQLRNYYDKHLDPEKSPTSEDLETLQAMEDAKKAFNQNLAEKFKSAIKELETLGYPGISDPKITITTKVSATDALKHDSAVQYSLTKNGDDDLKLPEKYNGLGYQNLISMVFLLIGFRDDWMQVGKAKKEQELSGQRIAPLHLVLLEEPEVHLHIQVQQVFIKKVFSVLRNHEFLKKNPSFSTQLVISSHSSHIAREVNFADLRYFKRLPESNECNISTAKVINLSDVFGEGTTTDRFVTRYLQTTHCDLFFADAVILVEGSAENMLIPHFIKSKYLQLNERYITILSINGRHSHRLKPLIGKLCLTTLIITDIDSALPSGHHESSYPERGKDLISCNYAITEWLLREKEFDKLLDISYENKEFKYSTPYDYSIRIAYQTPISVNFKDKENIEAVSSTFEDCLIYANLELLIKTNNGEGLVEKAHKLIVQSQDFNDLHKSIYNLLRGNDSLKAGFALDLIYSIDPVEVNIPPYIKEGLNWLQEQLKPND